MKKFGKPTVLLLHNPAAGRRQSVAGVEDLANAFSQRSLTVQRCEGLNGLRACLATRSDDVVVVCAGGDGTVNAALNVVGDAVPIVPYPLGNENLLAKYLGIESDVERLVDVVEAGERCDFDIATYSVSDRTQRFLLMLSCGFDADVVDRVHQKRTSHISKRNYVAEMMTSLRKYRFTPMEVTLVDHRGETHCREGHWVFVFNIAQYARGLPIAAHADPHDGFLDVYIFRGRSLIKNLAHAASVVMGVHGPWSGCEKFRATKISISAGLSVPLQVDGDPGGQTPVDVDIVPRGVRLIRPAAC